MDQRDALHDAKRSQAAQTQVERFSGECVGKLGAADLASRTVKIHVSKVDALREQLKQNYGQADKVSRALSILERHPEFEEFLWLLESGLL